MILELCNIPSNKTKMESWLVQYKPSINFSNNQIWKHFNNDKKWKYVAAILQGQPHLALSESEMPLLHLIFRGKCNFVACVVLVSRTLGNFDNMADQRTGFFLTLLFYAKMTKCLRCYISAS